MKPKVDPDYLFSTSGMLGQIYDDKSYIICKGCGTPVPKMCNGPVHNIAVCEAYHEGYKDGWESGMRNAKDKEEASANQNDIMNSNCEVCNKHIDQCSCTPDPIC